ncbi:MAG: 1,4-dihydroxy-2-naphthoate polyprenyltransferase, partial [Bacteroidota bacterium]|nr:1,4-dihydroxy-2-naphthoate polyprenyltransferase [Bacteroidota bacterium]
GKHTLVVKLGTQKAKIYHTILITTAILSAIVFSILNYSSPLQFLYFLIFPLIIRNIWLVFKIDTPRNFDPLLKQLAVSTLVFTVIFGLCACI